MQTIFCGGGEGLSEQENAMVQQLLFRVRISHFNNLDNFGEREIIFMTNF